MKEEKSMAEKKTNQTAVKCPLCNLPFEDGQTGNFLAGKFYHQECMRLNERLTNAKGQLGEKSLLTRFKKAQEKKPEETTATPPVGEGKPA